MELWKNTHSIHSPFLQLCSGAVSLYHPRLTIMVNALFQSPQYSTWPQSDIYAWLSESLRGYVATQIEITISEPITNPYTHTSCLLDINLKWLTRFVFNSLGTLDDPIIVKSFGDEQHCGCTGCPADSHQVLWLTVRPSPSQSLFPPNPFIPPFPNLPPLPTSPIPFSFLNTQN